MKPIFAKLGLLLLCLHAVLVLIGQTLPKKQSPASAEYENRERDLQKLFDESITMEVATFKKRINAVHMTQDEIMSFASMIARTSEQFVWRDLEKKMIFLVEHFSPEMLERLDKDGGMTEMFLWAYDKNYKNLIKELRQRGGNVSDALDQAIQFRPKLISVLLKDGAIPNLEIVTRVIRNKAKQYGIGNKLRTALPQLLKKVKNINQRDDDGATVLFAVFDDKKLVEMALNAGADINAQDDNGYTVLMLAVRAFAGAARAVDEDLKRSRFAAIAYLVQRGADPNIKNSKGESALSIAKKKGFTKLVTLFEGSKGKRKSRPFHTIAPALKLP